MHSHPARAGGASVSAFNFAPRVAPPSHGDGSGPEQSLAPASTLADTLEGHLDNALDPADPATDPRRYRLAFGGALSAGSTGWGTEIGNTRELYARYQLHRGIAFGASYFWLAGPNNEGNSYPAFQAEAAEGFAELHPFPEGALDPFARAGLLGFTHVEGHEKASRAGEELMLGLDLTLRHFAFGIHARFGATNQSWALFGLHSELRF